MAKLVVTDRKARSRAPYLRGILTRSLQDAGLGFEEAYALATRVRQDLGDKNSVSREDLRALVAKRLKRAHGTGFAERYLKAHGPTELVMIRDSSGAVAPFSRSLLRRTLSTCGLSNEQSIEVTSRIYEGLVKSGQEEIESEQLRQQVESILRKHFGESAAKRYGVLISYVRSGRPLLLLVGGTAGCGKSTITTEVANRLEIVRTVSTDMLREVMRVMVPEKLLPVLHESSFSAWRALPASLHVDIDKETMLTEGYYSQAQLLSVACEAVIQRAIRERVSLILEGVHVHPGLLESILVDDTVTVVMVMLGVLDRKELRRRIRGRGGQAPQRRAARYLEHFNAIWHLQSHLLSEADRLGVPIALNESKDATVQQMISIGLDALARDLGAAARPAAKQA